MRPFAIDDCDPLRDSDVREFQTYQQFFPPKHSIPGSYRSSATHPFVIDDSDPLWDFNVQEFQTFQRLFSPKYSIPRVTYRAPCVLLPTDDSNGLRHFGISLLAFLQSVLLWSQRSTATCLPMLTARIYSDTSTLRGFSKHLESSRVSKSWTPEIPVISPSTWARYACARG
jgi:hypothetical protein